MPRELEPEVLALRLGEKIRGLRMWRKMTLQNVADLSGLSKPQLSHIENNATAPPIGTLLKISRALGVNIGFFFQEESENQPISDVRVKKTSEFFAGFADRVVTAGCCYKSLTDSQTNGHLEFSVVEIGPRSDKELVFHSHLGEVVLFVLEEYVEFRQVKIGSKERVVFPCLFVLDEPTDFYQGHKSITLGPGDSLHFDSEIPHAFFGLGENKARALVVVHTP